MKDNLVVLAIVGEARLDAGDDRTGGPEGGPEAGPGAVLRGELLFAGGLGAYGRELCGRVVLVFGEPGGILGGGIPVAPPGHETHRGKKTHLGRMAPMAEGIPAAGPQQTFPEQVERQGTARFRQVMIQEHLDGGHGAAEPPFGIRNGMGGVELPDRLHRPQDR